MEYMKWYIILDNACGDLWRTKSYYDMFIAQHFSTQLICNPQLVWRQYLKPHYQGIKPHLTTKT